MDDLPVPVMFAKAHLREKDFKGYKALYEGFYRLGQQPRNTQVMDCRKKIDKWIQNIPVTSGEGEIPPEILKDAFMKRFQLNSALLNNFGDTKAAEEREKDYQMLKLYGIRIHCMEPSIYEEVDRSKKALRRGLWDSP